MIYTVQDNRRAFNSGCDINFDQIQRGERLDQNKNKKKYGKKENEMKDERCFLSTRWPAFAVSFDHQETKK